MERACTDDGPRTFTQAKNIVDTTRKQDAGKAKNKSIGGRVNNEMLDRGLEQGAWMERAGDHRFGLCLGEHYETDWEVQE